jgi:hypothetical protein
MYKQTCRYWSTPQPSGEDSQQDDGELNPEISVHGGPPCLGGVDRRGSTRHEPIAFSDVLGFPARSQIAIVAGSPNVADFSEVKPRDRQDVVDDPSASPEVVPSHAVLELVLKLLDKSREAATEVVLRHACWGYRQRFGGPPIASVEHPALEQLA